MAKSGAGRFDKPVFWLTIATGVVLSLIGARFLLAPGSAAFFFGIERRDPGLALHAVVGLRDLWLGLLLVALAILRQWLAVSVWFGLAIAVCFADALIAAQSSGRGWPIAFHAASGVFCGVLAWLAWRTSGKP